MTNATHEIFGVTDGQFQIVYDVLSFTFAAMGASTVFFWLRLGSIHEKYKSALVITGLVTFIAAYHYLRIFNSWVDAYSYPTPVHDGKKYFVNKPTPTGKPFNDAYRYMDWLLTVPLLLIEIVLVMDLSPEETTKKSWMLGVGAAVMIIIGYPGELILDSARLHYRWIFWALAMLPFAFVVFTLLCGLRKATNAERNPDVRRKILIAQWMTVISWFTYPIVYILPMLMQGSNVDGASVVVGIQVGYCISDIIAKCGVGFVIYSITNAKSKLVKENALLSNDHLTQ